MASCDPTSWVVHRAKLLWVSYQLRTGRQIAGFDKLDVLVGATMQLMHSPVQNKFGTRGVVGAPAAQTRQQFTAVAWYCSHHTYAGHQGSQLDRACTEHSG